MKRKSGHSPWAGRFMIFVLVVLMAGLIGLLFERLFPGLLSIVRTGDEQAIEAYIKGEGLWKGYACVFLLSAVQVVSVVLPGAPIQLAAGLLYGWFEGTVICFSGFVAGNTLVFFLCRRLGRFFRRLRKRIERKRSERSDFSGTAGDAESIAEGQNGEVPEGVSAQESWLAAQMNRRKPAVVVGLAMMVPGVPNGIIPHAASRADITGRGFVSAVMATCWLQILVNCLSGHLLIRGYIGVTVLLYALQFLLVGIIAWKREEILGRFS